MAGSGRVGRGIFTGLRDMFGLPGAPGTIEDRVRQVAILAVERPIPDRCPRCGGDLVLLSSDADRLHAELTTLRTTCRDCGIEEEWHQRG